LRELVAGCPELEKLSMAYVVTSTLELPEYPRRGGLVIYNKIPTLTSSKSSQNQTKAFG
jgi:hypothetical protein